MPEIFKVQILRTYDSDKVTMGEMYVNGNLTAMTLEKPWKENQAEISCIPAGRYPAILRYDKKRDKYFTIELKQTLPRTNIQIHVGNDTDDTIGCILVGLKAKMIDNTIGESINAITQLKTIFYGTDNPIMCPDLEISVSFRSLPLPLRFYASQNDKSFSWLFEDGFWITQGGEKISKFKEIVRDNKWIISRSENSGSFNGRYVRWGTLGNTPFQISNDLKNWTVLAADELLLRTPTLSDIIWKVLKENGGGLRTILNSKFVSYTTLMQPLNAGDPPTDDEPTDPRDEYNDDDPAHKQDGVIVLDFEQDYGVGSYDGEPVTIDDPSEYDDYSDDSGSDNGGE